MRARIVVFWALLAVGCGSGVEGEPFPDPGPQSTGEPTADVPPADDPPAAVPPAPAPPEATPAEPPPPPPPPRVVLVHTSHGTSFDNWLRSTDRYDFELGPELAPFAAYRDQLTVLDGFDGPDPQTFGTGAYDWGPSFVFTGDTFVVSLDYVDWHKSNRPGRATLDYEVSTETRFHGFALAFASPWLLEPSTSGMGTFFAAASARDQPVRPQHDVKAAHQQLTADLDLSSYPTIGSVVSSLADFMTSANLDDGSVRARAHAKLIATALATDQTRGVVYQATTLTERFNGVGLNELAHQSNGTGRALHDAARLTIAQRVAAVVDELAATPFYAGGTLLDHTIVVWVDDTGFASTPAAHSWKRLPIVWIGNLGGRIASGQYLRADPGRPYIDALRTLAEALELDPAPLGEPFASATTVEGVLR